jgi:ATP-dependent DNA helicase RecG
MDSQDLLRVLALGETSDWEFKSAKGGIPGSLWDSYSAMANTDGGYIVLGVEEKNSQFSVTGLSNADKMKKDLWSTLNNIGKVSINLLHEDDIVTQEIDNQTVLIMHVPRAQRRQRPVFIGQNPLTGTYRRNYEGDYHCTSEEVGRMLADKADEPIDSRILEHFGLDDLDPVSLQQYRQRFSSRAPDHLWLLEELTSLLSKLGGWRKDRKTGLEGLTLAGLLMFGKDEAIKDPTAIPGFSLDYREHFSDDPDVRWTDRLIPDGTWTGNLFQFYQRVIQRLTADIKVPFQLGSDLLRKDDTIVHEAIREALVNALIHADYRGVGGIIIHKYRSRIELSNPGTLLLPLEQVVQGGISECRNRSLQQMFLMIGGGEKAGSGIDKIRRGWKSENWQLPSIEEIAQPDRIVVTMPMTSFLPEEIIQKLRQQFGEQMDALSAIEVQALVTAALEGDVSNRRMQIASDEHPADLSRMLQRLVAKGLLEKVGRGRFSRYQIANADFLNSPHSQMNSPHKSSTPLHGEEDFPHKLPNLPYGEEGSPHKLPNSPHSEESFPVHQEWQKLLKIAAPSRDSRRLKQDQLKAIILVLCTGRYLTASQIGQLLGRNAKNLQERFLAPMLREGAISLKFPHEPNRPDQAYTTAIQESEIVR